ncbi:MAG: hypothetical protein AAF456_23550 [Planctomycetota bacterium]
MTTAPSPQTVPGSIASRLGRLRRKLTAWIVVHGLARWFVIVFAMLGVDMLIDRLFKMDHAQRLIMLVAMAAIAIYFFVRKLIVPLMTRPGDDALILAVESRNPETEESLISSYQLARQRRKDPRNYESTGASPALTEATIAHGAKVAEGVDFSSALDKSGNAKSWVMFVAGLLLTAGLAWGVMNNSFMQTWFNRNVLLGDDQWPQRTYLEIVGAEDGRISLPVGANHLQLVRVTEDSLRSDVKVTLEIETTGTTTRHSMQTNGKLDGREHEFSFYPSAGRMRATGGDDVTDWVEIDLVQPPTIDDLVITEHLPEYTGLEPRALVGTGQHNVLAGSRLSVSINANKPLQSCEVVLGSESFPLTPVAGSSTEFSIRLPVDDTQPIAGGQYEFQMVDTTGLANQRTSRFSIAIKDDQPPKIRAEKDGVGNKVVPEAVIPIAYAAADEYGLTRIYYDCHWTASDAAEEADQTGMEIDVADFAYQPGDNIRLFEKSYFTNGTFWFNEATRRLNLLDVIWQVQRNAFVQEQVPDRDFPGTQWFNPVRNELFILDESSQPARFPVVVAPVDPGNRLDLAPLQLKPGMVFRFTMNAVDNCPEQAGSRSSDEIILQIVTPEELRAHLLRREVDQRKAFEEAYELQLALTSELGQAMAMDSAGMTVDQFNAAREERLINIARSQKQIGTRLENIAVRFESFLEEVKNNGLDKDEAEQNQGDGDLGPKIETRFRNEIIGPIRELDQTLITLAGRHLENCRRSVADEPELIAASQSASQVQEAVLIEMKKILESMMESESYQEAINKLLEIKALEERIQAEINERNNPDDIFDPEDEDDIFDK